MKNKNVEPFWADIIHELINKKRYSLNSIATLIETSEANLRQFITKMQCQPGITIYKKLLCLYFWEFYCNKDNPLPEALRRFKKISEVLPDLQSQITKPNNKTAR